MNLRRGVVRGAASLGSVNFAASVLNAVALLFLARLLTPDDFGIVALATAVLSVVQSCTEMSLNNALIRKQTVDRSHIDTVWTMALIRAGLICLVFSIAALPLAAVYSNMSLVPVFLVSGLTGAILGLENPRIWLETKRLSFAPLAITQFVRRAFGVFFAVAFAFFLHSYWAIILGYFAGSLAVAVTSYLIVPYRPRLSLLHFREIWSFSVWVFLSQIFQTLNWRVDQLIIGFFVPKAQLGIYAMADNLAAIPARETVHPIRQVLFPGLANISQDLPRMRKSLLLSQSTIAMIIAPMGVGLALVAEPAVELVLGAKWLEAVPFIQIFGIVYMVGIFSIGLQPVSMVVGKTKVLFIRQFVQACIMIPAILAGLFFGGLIGAAFARLASDVFAVALEIFFTKRLLDLPVRHQLSKHGLTFMGLLAMAVGVSVVKGAVSANEWPVAAELGILAATGASIYVGTILVTWLALGRPEGPVGIVLDTARRVLHGVAAAVQSPKRRNIPES